MSAGTALLDDATGAAFADVLRSGLRRPRGMPSFEQLSDVQLDSLQHYIRRQAEIARGGALTPAAPRDTRDSHQAHSATRSGNMTIGSFSQQLNYSITSSRHERTPDSGVRTIISFEGTAQGYGQINGTLTLVASTPGGSSGPASYTGLAFLADGTVLSATGEGQWQQLDGRHQWRVRGLNMTSAGAVVLSDAVLDLETRSFRGTMANWS
jgi:hypothetical protein